MSRSPVPTGQYAQALQTTVTREVKLQYLLYLPKEYNADERRWPLVLFLHGAGERGDNLENVAIHGPPKLVKKGRELPFILVSPQCPVDEWWDVQALDVLLDRVVASYRVDPDRFYCTGLSMGGYGTWALAIAHPERFAAIVPICGGGGGNRHMAPRIKNVPVWCFHGAQDAAVPLSESEGMVEALKKCGGNVKFTIYPEAGHDAWTQTYDNPEMWEWMLGQRRGVRVR